MSKSHPRPQQPNPQQSKRRRISHTDEIITLLGPSRNRPSAVLPQRRTPRPEMESANLQQQGSNILAIRNENDDNVAAAAPLPKLVDSALTSNNIESALCMIDRNTKQKHDSFDNVLQAFHDLFRWSRLPNSDHRNFFMNEFVYELSGISRVMKFLKAHNMGDVYLCQLLQTELTFNE